MKKTLGILSLLLISITIIFAVASCGGLENYEGRLIASGYKVGVATKSDVDAMNETMRKEGIECNIIEYVGASLEANETEGEYVTIFRFESESLAKDFVEKVPAILEADEYVEREGAIVFIGTKTAINIALGK